MGPGADVGLPRPCNQWDIQQASYNFATYEWQNLDMSNSNGYLDNDNLSTSGVPVSFNWLDGPAPTYLPSGTITYGSDTGADIVNRANGTGNTKPLSSDSGGGSTGQVMVYCDP